MYAKKTTQTKSPIFNSSKIQKVYERPGALLFNAGCNEQVFSSKP